MDKLNISIRISIPNIKILNSTIFSISRTNSTKKQMITGKRYRWLKVHRKMLLSISTHFDNTRLYRKKNILKNLEQEQTKVKQQKQYLEGTMEANKTILEGYKKNQCILDIEANTKEL